jgi:hypothetical protein
MHPTPLSIPTFLLSLLFIVGNVDNINLVDVTSQSGINFKHVDGRSGKRYFLETVGSGCGFFDYDNDGYLDIYLVNSADLPGFKSEIKPKSALYRNNGDGTFTDVTDKANVGNMEYGAGCAVGDYNNDGYLDLYVTNFGPNVLYKNNGDGTFTEATKESGSGEPRWSLAATFADYDNDGNLDLYVTNYTYYSFDMHKNCKHKGIDIYCGPENYPPAPDALYHNNGDGTFANVSQKAGIVDANGRGMGVVAGDYNDDGYVDFYIANDVGDNFLFHNNKDGSFKEVGWMAGVECDENGNFQGSMGVDFGDYDNDGRLDIVVTNFDGQINSIYHNDGGGFFTDVSFAAGMGYSLPYVGWGVDFFDVNNDGYKDLFIANGHIHDQVEQYDPNTSYAQFNQVLLNDKKGKFVNASTNAGSGLKLKKVSRGTAFGDYDNDGKMDILINNANDTPDLLHNESDNQNNCIMLKLVGTKSNRDGIGAKVKIYRKQETGNRKQNKEKNKEKEEYGVESFMQLVQFDEVRSSSSYMSQNDLRLHFGLEKMQKIDRIEVRWPSGAVDVVENVGVNQILVILEGNYAVER